MKISVIGAGAMGGATVEGLVKTTMFRADDIIVSDPSVRVTERLSRLGVSTTSDNRQAAHLSDVVCVCVKPWLVGDVLEGMADVLNAEKRALIVIAAGVSSGDIVGRLPSGSRPPLFLVMPNIAISQLSSMTFIAPVDATDEATRLVTSIFDEMGTTRVTDEHHLSAAMTVASCGIAYAMRYVRAATEGAVELGFRADDARQVVMQTMLGAVRLLQATGMHPEEAIDLVTTPGGATIRGLNEMEQAGFTPSVIRGLKAGRI